MDTWLPVLFFGSALVFGSIFIRNYRRLRMLLRKHGKPVAFPLGNFSLLIDLKEAQRLVKELGDTPEARRVKAVWRRADISFFTIFAVLIAIGILFMFSGKKLR